VAGTLVVTAPPRLLFVVTEDWYFCSHRLYLACAAKVAGFDVSVATRVAGHGERIRAAGLRLYPLNMVRGGTNPWQEIFAFLNLVRIFREERPDIVHLVAVKPVIYGSLAAFFTGIGRVVSALPGLGYVFSSDRSKARLLRPLVRMAYRRLLSGAGKRLILQNPDDVRLFVSLGLAREDSIRLIRGSGVDTQRYAPALEPDGAPLVVLPARMLWDKGVGEFVAAARELRSCGVDARFALVGDADMENPASIPRRQLKEWTDEGVVEWWGQRDDMPNVFCQSALVCLPSYREGLPKALLEAASCGRAIVTSDVPGCREIVCHGDNGLLVPGRDAAALAAALAHLLQRPDERRRMGDRGRHRVLAEFSQESVSQATIAVYRELGPT
jgi:glycosyltransferase involved in cell wall biosynthesis